MTSNLKSVRVLFGAGVAAAAASYAWLKFAGFNDPNLLIALRLTARTAFMMYLVVFVARPLQQLFATPATRWLLRERRSFGIAFAAIHTVHLGLIACRFASNPELEYSLSGGFVGGIAYLLLYLMLITSFDAPARAIGAKAWRRLHKTGLYVIGFVFVATLLPDPGQPILTSERLWFTVLTAGAIFIRMTAWFAAKKRISA